MQPTHAGWYWDPAGRPGLFRWWNGVAWTRHVTPDRTDPAPEPLATVEPDGDGLLHAGGVAYPALPEPWCQCPAYPGFTDAVAQERRVGRTGRGEYDALIVIGSVPDRLSEGDAPEIATSLCTEILSTFYPDERPAGPPSGVAVEIDSHPGWRIDVQLDVEAPALDFVREDLVLIVFDLDAGPRVFYASLPSTEDVPRPDDAVALLRVPKS